MKSTALLGTTVCLIHLASTPSGVFAADIADPIAIPSKITEVTVFADRAQVTRLATAKLTTGTAQVAFEKLPGWIDEGSVRIALVPADAGQILDVQVKRTYLKRTSDEEFRKAEAAVREISDEINVLDDEKAVLDAQAKQVESVRTFSLDKLPKDAAVREIKPGEYGETVKFITTSLREIATARRELEKKRRDLLPERNVRERKLEELRQTAQLDQCSVLVNLRGSAAREATLSLTYMTPGATWEPVHELRAAPGAKFVTFASYAVVMQTSGEDWTDVELALSTQRTTETMKIPELDALLLGTGKRINRPVAQADTFQSANANFFANNGRFNIVINPDIDAQREYLGNNTLLIDNSKRIEKIFETLHTRGTTTRFVAMGKQTIRREGRSVRVPLGVAELAAQHRILAAPEISLNAARTVDFTNSTKQPFVPGKVSLFLDGAFLGMTETDFVAPGEASSLYLGVADQIKLSRTLDTKHSELRRGGQRTRMQVAFVVTVENLSDEATAVQLNERVPVSESDEVKVGSIRVAPEAKPDTKGLLKWDLNLAAKKSKELRIEYTLDYPTDLPQRTSESGKSSIKGSESFYRLGDQIKSLESKF